MTGNDIKGLRTELGMTSSAFATLLGVNPSTLYRWESEAEAEVKIDPNAARILAALQQARAAGGTETLKATLGGALLIGGGLFALFKLLEYLFSDDKAAKAEASAQASVGQVVRDAAGSSEVKPAGAAAEGKTAPPPAQRAVRKTSKGGAKSGE